MLASKCRVVILLLLPALSVAGRVVQYRTGEQHSQKKVELDSFNEEASEVESHAAPQGLCNYFNNSKQVHLDRSDGRFTMTIACKVHQQEKWHSSKRTTYQYEVHVEGPGGIKTSFMPSPQRPSLKYVKEGDPDRFDYLTVEVPKVQISLDEPLSINTTSNVGSNAALRGLWDDLGDAINLCKWSIVGNWNAVKHAEFNIDPQFELKCHRLDSYFHHTFKQTSAFAPGRGMFDGPKEHVCSVLKSFEGRLVLEDGTWTMAITCDFAKREKWYSSKDSTYNYVVHLEGPDGAKADFTPDPQRPVYKIIKYDFMTQIGYQVIALGIPQPTSEALGRLWPGLGKAIDRCVWTVVGDAEKMQHPNLKIDPDIQLHCDIPDSYWSRPFKV